MLRTIGKTAAMAIAGMGLVSTLAMAQPQSPSQPMGGQAMTCTKVDDSGYCIEAKGADDKMIVVRTEGVKIGEKMSCTTTGTSTTCAKVTTVK
jgi:hypothetical protein